VKVTSDVPRECSGSGANVDKVKDVAPGVEVGFDQSKNP
jgi:hypothetical protein